MKLKKLLPVLLLVLVLIYAFLPDAGSNDSSIAVINGADSVVESVETVIDEVAADTEEKLEAAEESVEAVEEGAEPERAVSRCSALCLVFWSALQFCLPCRWHVLLT